MVPQPHAPPQEPFGQVGVRQYVVPALAILCLSIACLCAIMWLRSLVSLDAVTFPLGSRGVIFRSTGGGIFVTVTDARRRPSVTPGGMQLYLGRRVRPLPDYPNNSPLELVSLHYGRVPYDRFTATGSYLTMNWSLPMGLSLVPAACYAVLKRRKSRRTAKSSTEDSSEKPAVGSTNASTHDPSIR